MHLAKNPWYTTFQLTDIWITKSSIPEEFWRTGVLKNFLRFPVATRENVRKSTPQRMHSLTFLAEVVKKQFCRIPIKEPALKGHSR